MRRGEEEKVAANPVDLLLSGKSDHTIRAYRQDLSDLRSFIGAADEADAVASLITGGRGKGRVVLSGES